MHLFLDHMPAILTREKPGVQSSPLKSECLKSEWWTRQLAAPLIAAAAVRLALLSASLLRSGVGILSGSDTLSYLVPGRNLLLHGRFFADGVPDLVRTPGYALFLALTGMAGTSVTIAAHVAVSLLYVLLVWKLARTVTANDRIAIVAAWIVAFEPIALANSFVLMSDTLFVVLLVLTLERLAVFLRTCRMSTLVMAGVSLTLATFVRPITYYLPVALAIGLFVVLARVPGLRVKAPAVLLLTVLPWVAAWQLRNRIETGYWGFCSITEVNLYYHDNAYIAAKLQHRDFQAVQKDLGYTAFQDHTGQSYLYPFFLEKHPSLAGSGQGTRLAFMHDEAVRTIRSHLKIYLRLCFDTFLKVTFDPDAGQFDEYLAIRQQENNHDLLNKGMVRSAIARLKQYPRTAVEKMLFEVYLLGLYFFAVRGLIRNGMERDTFWLLCGMLAYFSVVTVLGGGNGADARYRFPLMPIVCLLAATGIVGRRKIAEE